MACRDGSICYRLWNKKEALISKMKELNSDNRMTFESIIKSKAILGILVCLITMLFVTSCAGNKEPAVEYKDSEFVKDAALGWQERYDAERLAAEEKETEKQKEQLETGVNAELSRIEKYANEEFKKQGLKNLMTDYVSCLKEGADALQYYSSDNDKYLSVMQSVNSERRRIMTRLSSDYGLTVDTGYKDAFVAWLSNAETESPYSSLQEDIDKMVSKMKFEKEPDEYYSDYHTYSTNLKNTVGINFENLVIQVKLYDNKGVVVGTENVYLENFKADSTEKAEFSSDAKFEKMEVICDSWKESE